MMMAVSSTAAITSFIKHLKTQAGVIFKDGTEFTLSEDSLDSSNQENPNYSHCTVAIYTTQKSVRLAPVSARGRLKRG